MASGYSGIAGVILCGGLSTRMGGGDKTLLRVGARPMIAHVIDRLRPQCEVLAINANGDASRFAEYRAPVVRDEFEGRLGPLAGVLAGLEFAASRGMALVVTAAGDTPFFPLDLSSRLLAASASAARPIALASTRDPAGKEVRHPTFGLWPVELKDDLRGALQGGVRKVVRWADPHGAASAFFETGGSDPFFNVNTPGDMERAAEILEGMRP